VSRKAFIRKLMGEAPGSDYRAGSVAAAVICAMRGAHIVRAHDVVETVQAMKVVDAASA
jgi:dihydropteroate synthase